jgi:hypothetical protein
VRLSEKTIELNFCAQAVSLLGKPAFWFGLTQRQEAQAGFDAATTIGGRVILFQFKASNTVLGSGERRFQLHHRQLEALRARVRPGRARSVFYVLPAIGETSELPSANWDILQSCWLLDVGTLPTLAPPTTSRGTLRKNERHYADLDPPDLTIWSDPTLTDVIRADSFFRDGVLGADGILGEASVRARDDRPPRRLGRGAVAMVLPPTQ